MKNLKTILSLFAIAAVFSANAFAQEPVAVTADVEATLTLSSTNVVLGTIQQATSVLEANASDDATEDNVGSTKSPGSLTIVGSDATSVIVSWTTATLDTSPIGDAITFTPSVWNAGTEVVNGTAGTVDSETVGGTTIDIGGELDAPSGTGAYSTANGSPITFTVQYE